MEITNNFGKGLHTDFDPQDQPEQTYRKAVNVARDLNGTLVNDVGSRIFSVIPEDMTVIGSTTINQDIVLFLANGVDSEIGVIEDSIYRTVLRDPALGFDMNGEVLAESRVDYKNDRLVYFVDGINSARIINIDNVAVARTIESLELFLSNDMPRITDVTVAEDGNLPTGVYQFAVRLLTSGGNKTTPSIVTGVWPIINETRAAGTDQYDGAPAQVVSNKSLSVRVESIDPKFKFIELIAITYIGSSNQFSAFVVDTKQITGSSIVMRYASVNQQKEAVLREELSLEPTTYTIPTTITQKDSRLLLGNLKARNYSSDFQLVANAIVSKYTIKELTYSETVNIQTARYGEDGLDLGAGSSNFNNYKSEINTALYKGYQRDEVYSFAIVPIYKDLTFGWAYHIPANHGYATPATNHDKLLGTFISQDYTYPSGFHNLTGEALRYHRMPSMDQEPIFNNGAIRVLGVDFQNIDLSVLSSEERANIIGVAITRELRTEENKSILAQGVVNLLLNPNMGDMSKPKVVSAFSGKNHHNYSGSTVLQIERNKAAFYAPETTMFNESMLAGSIIKPVALLQGKNYMVGEERTGSNGYVHMFSNYTAFYNINDRIDAQIRQNTIQYVPAGQEDKGSYGLQNVTYRVHNRQNNGFLFFETDSDIDVYNDRDSLDYVNGEPEITVSADTTNVVRFQKGGFTYIANQDEDNPDAGYPAFTGDTRRKLFNIVANRPNQYGTVTDKQYILINHKLGDISASFNLICFGGDTFINKFSLITAMSEGKAINDDEPGRTFKTLNYYFCESTINAAYRHSSLNAQGQPENLQYYPKTKKFFSKNNTQDGLLNIWTGWGHANGYNRQYSFDNNIKMFFSRPLLLEEEVYDFPNRVIYSEQSVESEQLDAYRMFLANNYHDVPKNKGAITDLFVFNGSLYIHTAKTLYKALMNEQTAMVSTSGEMVLGSGGLFPMPSKELFTVSGGYAGTLSPKAACNTPFGRIFLDNHQGKIFILADGLSEISSQGMTKYFRGYIQPNEKYTSVYDYRAKRWILSNSAFTISYSTNLQSWSSTHSWHANHMLSLDDRVFIINPYLNEVHTLDNQEEPGKYFDNPIAPMILGISVNAIAVAAKSFDDMVLHTSCTAYNTARPWRTFDTFKAWNRIQSTGERTIFVPRDFTQNLRQPTLNQVKANLKNNEYRIATPQDLVIDPSVDVHDTTNLTSDGTFRPRMKGKHMEVELGFDNSTEQRTVFRVYGITTVIRPVSG